MGESSTLISDLPDNLVDTNTSTRILNDLRNDETMSIITVSEAKEVEESTVKETVFNFILLFVFGLISSSKVLDNALLNIEILKRSSNYVIFISVFILSVMFIIIQKLLEKYYF